ncbi:hypothetical protein BDV25DRAFT_155510 [Aspergillus avenaceus]|uniref:Uncharacterized protein n=1 Tax=Aspergillus avenaceus TaxID=36643 RepID=A0A5N6TU88_ASPAV|nr:hypothetical protein BDV25DRAFT_155510 [Aspergillus avenaceus]
MTCSESILSWIRDILLPGPNGSFLEASKKRRLTANAPNEVKLASPLMSVRGKADSEMTSTLKRRRLGKSDETDALLEFDATQPGIYSSSEHLSQSDSESSSMASVTLSTMRKIMNLLFSRSVVERKALDVDDPPGSAQNMVNRIVEIGHALQILPHTLQSNTVFTKPRCLLRGSGSPRTSICVDS